MPTPRRFDTADPLKEAVSGWRRAGEVVGFVPTMGALHDGHASLVRAARAECDRVLVSVFVNPLQFGPGEDLGRYPRTLAADMEIAGAAGADALFVPSVGEMYPDGFNTTVSVSGLTEGLCGASRPGHFNGVTTVVARLFGLVGADRAYFGQKDYQQVAVIRRMARDLALPVVVVDCPIVRDPDGLAMSSRNRYLDASGRRRALALSGGLTAASSAYRRGEVNAGMLLGMMSSAVSGAGCRVDYVAAVDPVNLFPLSRVGPGSVLLVAAWVGDTRLIDNHILS